MILSSKKILLFLLLGCCFALLSCNNTKYLAENESLLNKNTIRFESDLNIERRSNLAYELNNVVKQQPNSKFLRVFGTRLWLYNRINKQDSVKKFKRWLKRKVGEKPVIYSPKLTESSAETMQFYLNNKGYFNAGVEYRMETRKKKTNVTYTVTPNRLLKIKAADLEIEDQKIKAILEKNKEKSLIEPEVAVNNKIFDQEKNRISTLLRNNGYAYFYPNYVKFLSYDSTGYKASVTTTILPPENGDQHETYTIGDIYINPAYSVLDKNQLDTIDMGNGFYFLSTGEKLPIKTKPILNAIFLEKGKLYSQKAYEVSNLKLNALGLYKFVSIRYRKDEKQPNQIIIEINLTPSKKQELGYALDFYTNNSSSFGTGVNLNYKNKNLFKGAEILLVGAESGVEFDFRKDDQGEFVNLIRSLELTGKADLYFPKFIVPFSLERGLKSKSPKTKLSLRADYTQRSATFTSTLFSSSFGYEWQIGKRIRHTLNPVKLDFFVVANINDDFQEDVLDNNQYLNSSIDNQFYLGGEYSFSYTGPQRRNGSSWFFLSNLEVSGNSINIADLIFDKDNNFKIFDNDYSQFLRTDFDLRYYNQLTRRVVLASRLALSGGFAYGNSPTLPYPKQYFVGGTSSVRAWGLRELGPGSYDIAADTNAVFSRQAYQQGDVKIEGGLELRFDIFWTLEGAFFLDFGNIWTLQEDIDRSGSKISPEFYKQIAVGVGYGIRLDFSYFVIRFDMGYKVRNPFPNEEGKYTPYDTTDDVSYNDKFNLKFKNANFNLGVGYPF